MAKFKIKMKLAGLELDIEGSREDIPLIAANLGQQLTGLIEPAVAIASGEEPIAPPPVHAPTLHVVEEVRKRKRRAPAPSRSPESIETVNAPLDFRHDPAKYGSPKQAWKTADKAIWLLHVVEQELSGTVLVGTFNKHFKQAGTITVSNANRDLGRLKSKSPAVVGEDTTKNPSQWFLTDEGKRQALKLVGDALGRAAA
jgi:hypothetical protein